MKKNKSEGLYLSDRPPLTPVKVVLLAISYILLLLYVFICLLYTSKCDMLIICERKKIRTVTNKVEAVARSSVIGRSESG